MSLNHSPIIVTNGLVFLYDAANKEKSWKGKPTTNYAYLQNPRIDASYANYSATASGYWNDRHRGAIRVYNDAGSEITGYVNTGVTDWTNTYHAVWEYDADLSRPVVVMRDYDGQWKAKSFGLSVSTPTAMGLTNGSTYTISWLSWTDDLTKCANAGMYSRRTSDGVYSFWDGQSNSYGTAFNTKVRTWQRVYATFTVNAAVDPTAAWSCYMYGHYGNRGTVKIADVQIETGSVSGFSKTQTRSNTQAIIDLTGSNTVTATSLTYAADGSFSFNGSSDYISTSTAVTAKTVIAWCKLSTAAGGDYVIYGLDANGADNWLSINANKAYAYATETSDVNNFGVTGTTTLNTTNYYQICCTIDTNTVKVYVNGVEEASSTQAFTIGSWNTAPTIGRRGSVAQRYFPGNIDVVSVYNRVLSAAEIRENFNALRGRYGV